jgi:hypothetical protein
MARAVPEVRSVETEPASRTGQAIFFILLLIFLKISNSSPNKKNEMECTIDAVNL